MNPIPLTSSLSVFRNAQSWPYRCHDYSWIGSSLLAEGGMSELDPDFEFEPVPPEVIVKVLLDREIIS